VRGDPTDKLADEVQDEQIQAVKTAAENAMQGAQLPGTSTGGDIGVKPEDGVTAIITAVGLGAEISAAKKQAEEKRNKQENGRKQQEGEKKKREEEKRKEQEKKNAHAAPAVRKNSTYALPDHEGGPS
jgi:uncharacterized protein HemX